MGHSLDVIKLIVNLHIAIGSPLVDIYIKETYPFFDEDAYKQEVEDCLIQHNNDNDVLTKKLKQHLSTCEQIIRIWGERSELWDARSRLIGKENEIDSDISYEIYCTLGGGRNNIMRFYGDVMLLRNNNGKVEEKNPFIPFTLFDKSWCEYNPEVRPLPDTDRKTLTVHLVRYAELTRRFLSKYVGNIEDLPMTEQPPQQADKLQAREQTQPKLDVPQHVLMWLQETKCANGKAYIESATATPLKWLQNKQFARELLTHDKIKGNLSDAEVGRQVLKLFIHHKGNKPLLLAKPKKSPSIDSEKLSDYLANLEVPNL